MKRIIILLLLCAPLLVGAQTLTIWTVASDTVEIDKNIKSGKWIVDLNTGIIYQTSHAIKDTLTLKEAVDSSWVTQKFATYTQHQLKANIASPTFTGTVAAPVYKVTTTDTTSALDLWTVQMRVTEADTSLWLLIRKTGTIAARWKKLTQ